MSYQTETFKVPYEFEIEIERDDSKEAERRYRACCSELAGCSIRASTKAKALHKIKTAIVVWFDLADRQLSEQAPDIEEMIAIWVPD